MKKTKGENPDYELALIGHSESGKTTLAAGLCATSTEYTVSYRKRETRNYIEPLMAAIEKGVWPSANSEELLREIELDINREGEATRSLAFKDYEGERANHSDFLSDIVKDPDGALILINPGMSILHDPEKRNKMTGNINDILSYLAKGNRCRAIALVVTAADRLKTDLKDSAFPASPFQECVKKIENLLRTIKFHRKCKWKKFEVSVSGELASQDQPRIASGTGNTSLEPFRWLLEKIAAIHRRDRWIERLKKRILPAALVCLFALSMLSAKLYWHERTELNEREDAVREWSAKLDNAVGYKDQKNIEYGCTELEEHRKELNDLKLRFLKNKARKLANDILVKVESPRLAWFTHEMSRLGKLIETQLGETDELLTENQKQWERLDTTLGEFVPLSAASSNEHASLREKWRVVKEGLYTKIDKYNEGVVANKLCSYDSEAPARADKETLDTWRRDIAKWEPLTPDGDKRKTELIAEFDTKRLDWHQLHLYAETTIANLLQELDEVCRDPSTSEQRRDPNIDQRLHRALVACRAYQPAGVKKDGGIISQEVRLQTWGKLSEARGKALDALGDSLSRRWDAKDKKEPEFSPDDLHFIDDTIKEALSTADYDCWKEALDKRLEQKREQWRENQKKICDDFIVGHVQTETKNALYSLHKFCEFHSENARNPYVPNVAQAVEEKVGTNFLQLISILTNYVSRESVGYEEQIKKQKMDFRELTELCNAMLKTKHPVLTNSPWFGFSQKCKEIGNINNKMGFYGSFLQKFEITKVQVTLDYMPKPNAWFARDGIPVGFKGVTVTVKGTSLCSDTRSGSLKEVQTFEFSCDSLNEADNHKLKTVWIGTGKEICDSNPWRQAYLEVTATDRNRNLIKKSDCTRMYLLFADGKLKGEQSKGIVTNTITLPKRWTGDESPKVHVRIHVMSSGYDIRSFIPPQFK